jgi:hypothetical protein
MWRGFVGALGVSVPLGFILKVNRRQCAERNDMAKLIYGTSISLDGYIEDADGSFTR